MQKHCQDCLQPLVVLPPSDNTAANSVSLGQDSQAFQILQSQQIELGIPTEQQTLNQPLFLFAGAKNGDPKLTVKDLIENSFGSSEGLQLQYPLCFDCFDKILLAMDEKSSVQEKERKKYSDSLAQLENDLKRSNPSKQEELDALAAEEKELDRQLAALELEESTKQKTIDELQEYHDQISTEENDFWQDFATYEKNLNNQQDQSERLKVKHRNYQKMLKRLQETTFINEVFQINSVDEIATIGGFRLGKTQRVEVGWDEISAALGQVVYLTVVLAHRLKYKFEKYLLLVNGSYSKICIPSEKNVKFELYFPNNMDSFNKGLEKLLDCIKEFACAVEEQGYAQLLGRQVMLHEIQGDKINQSSIRYSSDNMEQWTRACKRLLMQLQQLCLVCQLKEESDLKRVHQNDPMVNALNSQAQRR